MKRPRTTLTTDLERALSSTWTASEAARRWRLPFRTVRDQFAHGHVPGAVKIEGRWRCPAGTPKPAPKRGGAR